MPLRLMDPDFPWRFFTLQSRTQGLFEKFQTHLAGSIENFQAGEAGLIENF
jgi:hypothetical protein